MNIVEGRPLEVYLNEKDLWMSNYISPGVVGSVGDVNVAPQLKTSTPDFPPREYAEFSGRNLSRLGSYCQEIPPTLIDSRWQTKTDFRNIHGVRFQNVRPAARTNDPIMAFSQKYNFQGGSVNAIKQFGNVFIPATLKLTEEHQPKPLYYILPPTQGSTKIQLNNKHQKQKLR